MENYIKAILTRFEQAPFSDTQRTAKEITAHVFEFIEWLSYHSQGHVELISYWDAQSQSNKRVFCKYGSRSVIHDAMPLEEVYQYWLTNIKNH